MINKNKILNQFSSINIETSFLYLLIKILSTLFALYIFALFTPLIDSNNYIEGYYSAEGKYRTLYLQRLVTFILELSNPLITQIIFSIFSGLGILILSITMKNRFLLLFLLFPSALVWTSIVGKEAIFYGCVALILAIWSFQFNEIKKKNRFLLHLLTVILLIICGFLRPHYTIPLIYLISSTFILFSINRKKIQTILLGSIFLTCTSLIIYIWKIIPENLMRRGYGSIDPSARASRFEFFNIDLLNPHLVFTEEFIFKNGIFSIIGPFPSELLLRNEFIPFFIEGITILIIPIAIAFMLKNTKKYYIYKKYFYYALLPAILMLIIIHAPLGLLNPGTAIRWRVNFELIIYLAPLIIYLKSKYD